MDPVSAAGFASSLITFIDFSYKLVQGSVTLYQSAAGASDENIRISSIVDDLRNITETITEPSGSPEDSKHWQQLSNLARDCHAVSKELTDILEGLKRKEGNKAWRSFEAGWKSLRKSKDIVALEQRLNLYRVQLLLRINMILSENQSSVKSQLDEMQKSDVKFFRETIKELSNVHQATKNLEAKLLAEADLSLHVSTNAQQAQGTLEGLRAELSGIVETLRNIPTRAPADLHVLNRLHFGSLYSRVDRIDDAEFKTFTWFLREPDKVTDARDNDDDSEGNDKPNYPSKYAENKDTAISLDGDL
ncbi:hypothetical protein ACHAQA_008334, partial [Verticillium albo-atrum]